MKRLRFTRLGVEFDKEVIAISKSSPQDPSYWVLYEITKEEQDKYRGMRIFGSTGQTSSNEVVIYARPGINILTDAFTRKLCGGWDSFYRWEKVKHVDGLGNNLMGENTPILIYEIMDNETMAQILLSIEE